MCGYTVQPHVLHDGAGFGVAGPPEVLSTEIVQGVGQAAEGLGAGVPLSRQPACKGRGERRAGLNVLRRAREVAGRARKPPRGRTLSQQVLPGDWEPGNRGPGVTGVEGAACRLPREQGGRAWQLRGRERGRGVGPTRGGPHPAPALSVRSRAARGVRRPGRRGTLRGPGPERAWTTWLPGLKPAVAELTCARGGRVEG